jgi:hypothetical protein
MLICDALSLACSNHGFAHNKNIFDIRIEYIDYQNNYRITESSSCWSPTTITEIGYWSSKITGDLTLMQGVLKGGK